MSHHTTPTAIPTEYNGTRYRSRLEARWAIFLDKLDFDYQYEDEGYELSTGQWYLPDFHLFEPNVILEIKPATVTDVKRARLIYRAAVELTASGICNVFVVPVGAPVGGTNYAAVWKHGERTFSFDAVRDPGDVAYAAGCASKYNFGTQVQSLTEVLMKRWGVS